MLKFSCDNLPLSHHEDPGCPHCIIAMNINDYLLSMDAQDYVKDMRAREPTVTKTMTDGDCAALGLVMGLAIVAADMIYGYKDPLLQDLMEQQFQNAYCSALLQKRAGGEV